MTLTYFRDYQELFRGCIAYWDGSVNTTLQDIIGSNNATIVGATKTANDRFGIANKAYYYNGSSEMLIGSNGSNMNFNLQEKTLIFWIYVPSGTTGYRGLFSTCNYKFVDGYYVHYNYTVSNAMGYSEYDSSGTPKLTLSSGTSCPVDTWIMVTISRGNSNQSIYHNATLTGSLSTVFTSVYSASYVYIGRSSYRSGYERRWMGNIGEVMIFNRALSASEIKTLYNLMKAKYLYPIQSGIRGVE